MKKLMISDIIREKHLDQPHVVVSTDGGNLCLAPLDSVLEVADTVALGKPAPPTFGATIHGGTEAVANILRVVRPGHIISLAMQGKFVICTPCTPSPETEAKIQKVLELGCLLVNTD
jgi:hypothetical protein